MRKLNMFGRAALALGAAGMVLPTQVLAAQPVAVQQQVAAPVVDVQVNGGVLAGTVVNAAGQPVDGAVVAIYSGETKVGSTVTSRDGAYRVNAQSGSMYIVVANGAQQIVRTWDAEIAPPAARTGAVLVQANGTLRSQDCCDPCAPTCGAGGCGMGGKVLAGVGIGAGVILGIVALSNADDAEDDAADAQALANQNAADNQTLAQAVEQIGLGPDGIAGTPDDLLDGGTLAEVGDIANPQSP